MGFSNSGCISLSLLKQNIAVMATITVEVEDAELVFLRELLTKFPFVKISEDVEEDSEEAVRANIREGIRELSLVEEGKLKARSAREFLNEL